MSQAAIDKTNFISQAWQNIYTEISNKSNIADPTDSGGRRKWIYARLPNTKQLSFPLMVLSLVGFNQDRPSVNMQHKNIQHTLVLTIYSSDDNVNGDISGKGIQYLDAISNDVVETLNSSTVRERLRALGIENITFECGAVDTEELEETTCYVREFTINCETRKSVF